MAYRSRTRSVTAAWSAVLPALTGRAGVDAYSRGRGEMTISQVFFENGALRTPSGAMVFTANRWISNPPQAVNLPHNAAGAIIIKRASDSGH